MKLFILPQLAQLEVFKQFHPSEFFSISLCSQWSFNVLKIMKYRHSRLVVEPCGNTNWNFSIKIRNEEFPIINVITSLNYNLGINNVTIWELGNFKIFIRSTPHVMCGHCPVQCVRITRDIQKYLCDLFSLPSTIIYKEYGGSHNYKHLIRDSIHTSILHQYPPIDGFLEKFYNFHSNQVLSIHRFTENFSADMNKSHGIHQVENLVVPNASMGIRWYIMRFKGKNALFKKARLYEHNIEEFLNLWRRKANDNLETFIAYHERDTIFWDITDDLELWDTEKNGKVYPYNSIISEHHTFPKGTFDCEGGYSIRRGTDGRMATLKLTPQCFMFFVWK